MFKEIFDIFCNLSFNSKDMKNDLSDGGINSYVRQGCALTAPGRLRRLKLDLGRLRKNSRALLSEVQQ